MSLESDIWVLAEGLLEDDSHFLVDVKVSLSGNKSKVRVLLDGDEGITIDACANLSRALGNELESTDRIPGAYTLEVSSPGIDYPLKSPRHFRKNIGRQLKVRLLDGQEIKGILTGAGEHVITLERQKGKGKKREVEKLDVELKDIEKAIVQISFK